MQSYIFLLYELNNLYLINCHLCYIIDADADETITLDLDDGTADNSVTIANGFDITFKAPHDEDNGTTENDNGVVTIADGTKLSASFTWDEVF